MDWLSVYPDWVLTHGAALLVVVPLLMGAVTAVLPRQSVLSWPITFIVALTCMAISLALVGQVWGGESLLYKLGGWAPPHGISYVVDGLSAPVLLLISAVAVIALIYGLPSVKAEIEPKKRAPFYAAFMICLAGLLGMVVTGDAFNIFVFLEVSSISTYSLVAMGAGRDRRALSAAYNYLIMGSIGATFFVIGLGFLYMETGTLNMADMARILRDLDGGSRVVQVAFGFILVGLGLKIAMFPLHTWLPGAYAHSPSFVTIFLAATATKAALYLVLRFTFVVFDIQFDYVGLSVTTLLVGLGVLAMILASLQAIFQTDIRRTLAYSSIAQVGYMLLGIGLATFAGLTAGYLHLLNHAIIKGALFIAVGACWYRFGITRIENFAGLAKLMPWTMAGFSLAGLSLIGVPFTAGFVSKWQLASAAAEKGWWWAIAVIMLSSTLALIYVGRIILAAYFQEPPKRGGKVVAANEAPAAMLIPLWTLSILSLVIGIRADLVVDAAQGAARVLLAGAGGGIL